MKKEEIFNRGEANLPKIMRKWYPFKVEKIKIIAEINVSEIQLMKQAYRQSQNC